MVQKNGYTEALKPIKEKTGLFPLSVLLIHCCFVLATILPCSPLCTLQEQKQTTELRDLWKHAVTLQIAGRLTLLWLRFVSLMSPER